MKTQQNLKILSQILIFTLGVLVTSCDPKDDDPNSGSRKTMLENMVNNLIIPSYESFLSKAEVLSSASVSFSDEVNEENLIALQESWKEAVKAWNATQSFNYFGPADDSLYNTILNNFPSEYPQIENRLATSQAINASFIESLSTKEKGLPAVEYLIFSKDGNAVILEKFLSNAENRKKYLTAVCENIKNKASNLVITWQPAGKNYKETFLSISKSGTDAGSSTNLLANSLIQAVENIKNNKLGIPLGKGEGGIQQEKVEAPNAQYSFEIIKVELEAIENAFKGKSAEGDLPGFDDYLDKVNAKWQGNQLLSDRINQQFQSIRTILGEINDPLDKAVTTETLKVDKLYNSFISLVSLLKGEMISKLGLSVNYVDNDGD